MREPLSTNVSASQKVLIKPVVEHFDENADMCAINWFKGTLAKKLEGPDDRQRENLLIVCSPERTSL